jgi:hypothetical protein
MTYQQGHVKRNLETGEIALRTTFGEDNPQMARLAWLVATSSMGARNAYTAEVESWADLYVPEPPITEGS